MRTSQKLLPMWDCILMVLYIVFGVVGVYLLFSPNAHSAEVYRCGSVYQGTPCPSGTRLVFPEALNVVSRVYAPSYTQYYVRGATSMSVPQPVVQNVSVVVQNTVVVIQNAPEPVLPIWKPYARDHRIKRIDR